ncbi:uncharacterized protein CBL_20171 [Carabus blaptoides fortunei]
MVYWWNKCRYGDVKRQEFIHCNSNCYTEDLLTLHEIKVEKLRSHYEENKSVEPSPTSTECYWRKPKLAGVGTNIEFLSSKDLGADDIPEFEDGDNFFEEMIQTAGSSKCNSELLKIYQPASPVEQLDVHLIVIKFKEDLANDFLMYASNIMTEELCVEACIQIQEQHKNKLWFKLRYSRVTASKVYDVAHCRKIDGVIVEQILGVYKVRDTVALERGRILENEVLKVVEQTTKLKFKQSGLVLSKIHPIFGASPDAISEEYVAEIKCPSSEKAKKRYSTQTNKITAKFNAQVQLKMHMYKKNKALFCIADPEFEKNNKITIITVDYDKSYIEGLMKKAELFWIKYVLPRMLKAL